MKKKLSWLLIVGLLLALVACQGQGGDVPDANATEPGATEPTDRPTLTSEPTPEAAATDGPATELTINLDELFVLPAGASALVAGTDLRLTFTQVVEDSRCPTDVDCVWAGRALVEMEVQLGAAAAQTIVFDTDTTATERMDTVQVNGYTIHLQSLDPYPQTADAPIPFADYQATIVVSQP